MISWHYVNIEECFCVIKKLMQEIKQEGKIEIIVFLRILANDFPLFALNIPITFALKFSLKEF